MEILRLIGLIIILVGMVNIYYARKIAQKHLSKNDYSENTNTNIVKTFGLLLCIAGLCILSFVKF